MVTRTLRLSILVALGFAVQLNANDVPLTQVMRQANAGDVQSERNLGEAYLDGRGLPQHVEEGITWLKKAIAQKDPYSAYALGQYYESLPPTAENQHEMLSNYQLAANWGHTDAQTKIGNLLLTRAMDPELSKADRDRARGQGKGLLEFAANAGNAHAAKTLGDLYLDGKQGIPQNQATALSYYGKAADAGDGTSAMWLYDHYTSNPKAKDYSLPTGIRYLREAADHDVAQAQLDLATRYEEGHGLPVDKAEALVYAKRAAGHGLSEATVLVQRLSLPPPAAVAPPPAPIAPVVTATPTPAIAVAAPKVDPPAQVQPAAIAKPALTDVFTSGNNAPATTKYDDAVSLRSENTMLREQLTEREQSLIELRSERDDARGQLKQEQVKLVAALAAQHQPERVVVREKQLTPAPQTHPEPPAAKVNPDILNENAVIALQAGQYDTAVHNFKQAAEAGSQRAINNLGMLYFRGVGVTRDIPEAMKYFTQAAAAGNGSAANNLGYIYQYGVGVTPDTATAIRWYKAAIQMGNRASLTNLQQLLANGAPHAAPTESDSNEPDAAAVASLRH